MQVSEILGDKASTILNTLEDIDHAISLNNVSDNKWQIIISFDLSDHNLTEFEINALNALLKHL